MKASFSTELNCSPTFIGPLCAGLGGAKMRGEALRVLQRASVYMNLLLQYVTNANILVTAGNTLISLLNCSKQYYFHMHDKKKYLTSINKQKNNTDVCASMLIKSQCSVIRSPHIRAAGTAARARRSPRRGAGWSRRGVLRKRRVSWCQAGGGSTVYADGGCVAAAVLDAAAVLNSSVQAAL